MRSSAVIAAVLLAVLGAIASVGAEEAPRLDGAKIMPTSGDTNTLWTFMVVYHGTATPTSRGLKVDTRSYAMQSAGAAPGGGVMYKYQTKLTAGTHKYRFRFVVGTQTLLMPGPTESDWLTSLKVAQGQTFSISGTVTCGGTGLAGVSLRISQSGQPTAKALTDAQGNFSAKNLAPGSWAVTPSLPGFTFTPASRRVTLPPANTQCNFVATRQRSG